MYVPSLPASFAYDDSVLSVSYSTKPMIAQKACIIHPLQNITTATASESQRLWFRKVLESLGTRIAASQSRR